MTNWNLYVHADETIFQIIFNTALKINYSTEKKI